MRDAANNKTLVAQIKEKTGIEVDIIDGEQEAAIITNTKLGKLLNTGATFLYVDVGGGQYRIYGVQQRKDPGIAVL